jgi:hypothetical protein
MSSIVMFSRKTLAINCLKILQENSFGHPHPVGHLQSFPENCAYNPVTASQM